MTYVVKFVSLYPLPVLLAAASVAMTVVAAVFLRRRWARRAVVARLAVIFGWATICVYFLLGFELMTINYIAATRPRITPQEIRRDHREGKIVLLLVTLAGVLLGGPGVLIRRLAAPPQEPNSDLE